MCKVYKVNNHLKTFEKTTTNKKIIHGLHDMLYFEGKKKHSCNIINVFALGYLSTAILFVYGKALAVVTKCSIVDVAGVLNPCQYELTCIAYRNKIIQVLMKGNNWPT